MESVTVHDPFMGVDVQISNRLVDRLRGKYASGPHLPNGNPEFGWRQFQSPPIQHEAAKRIEALELALRQIWSDSRDMDDDLLDHIHSIASRAIIEEAT